MSTKTTAWIAADPLENYSSLHEFSLTRWLGWKSFFPKMKLWIQFDFNLKTPFNRNPQADIIFRTIDANQPVDPASCFSITGIKRWRLNIAPFHSFKGLLNSLIRWNRCNYTKSKKVFSDYGCTTSFIEGDWSEHVDTVYKLYCNVAKSHGGDQLYDLSFFQKIAKQNNFKLLCAWYQGEMIAMFVIEEEPSSFHSTCGGMDYHHSSKSYAYSWLSFEVIRLAIEAQKYDVVDVGLTADEAKQAVGFEPIPVRIDVYAKNRLTRSLLKALTPFVSATITPEAKLKFQLNCCAKNSSDSTKNDPTGVSKGVSNS